MQNKPRKVRRQSGSDVDENRGGVVPLSLPPVRVNQGGLTVEGRLIITVQITIEKLWNLELISNMVIFYPSRKVVGNLGPFGKILTFKKYTFSFSHTLYNGGTKPVFFITETIFFTKSLNALMTT